MKKTLILAAVALSTSMAVSAQDSGTKYCYDGTVKTLPTAATSLTDGAKYVIYDTYTGDGGRNCFRYVLENGKISGQQILPANISSFDESYVWVAEEVDGVWKFKNQKTQTYIPAATGNQSPVSVDANGGTFTLTALADDNTKFYVANTDAPSIRWDGNAGNNEGYLMAQWTNSNHSYQFYSVVEYDVPFESGSVYYLKALGTDEELYLNMETAGVPDSGNNACVSATPSLLYVTQKSDNEATKWRIRLAGENGNTLSATSWNTRIDGTSEFYWSIVVADGDFNTENPVVSLYQNTASNIGYAGWGKDAGDKHYALYDNSNQTEYKTYFEVIKPSNAITYTLIYKYNGQEIFRETNQGIIGSSVTSTTPAFFSDAPVSVELIENKDTYEIILTNLSLPFKHTATTDNMIWQAVQQHANQDNHKWSYDAEVTTQVGTKNISNNNAEGYSDNELWAFVGSYPEGFKIYNKAAGLDKCLNYQGEGFAVVSEATENNIWNVTTSSAGSVATDVCGFAIDNKPGYYLNYQGDVVKWHDNNDQGSSCSFYSPATPLLAYSAGISNDLVGVVGGHEDCGLAEARTAAAADEYDVEAAAALREAIAKHASAAEITFDANKFYRLRAAGGSYLAAGVDEDNLIVYGNEANTSNLFTIVSFVPTEAEGVYNIANQGYYLGKLGALNESLAQVKTVAEAGKYTVTAKPGAAGKFFIQDTEQTLMHETESYGLMNCLHNNTNQHEGTYGAIIPQVTAWDPSAWQIEPVNTVNVALTHTDADANVGLACFPFPVKANGDGSKLYYLFEDTYKQTATPVVTYAEVNSVPAGIAFMIRNEELSTVTLAIDYNSVMPTADTKNIIVGGFRKSTAEAGDYMLESTDSGLAFVPKAEAPEVAANYAYLPAAQLTSNALAAENLPLADPSTTAIDEISVEGGVAEGIYDLQGRRLAAPVKGINIINGKKVLVK